MRVIGVATIDEQSRRLPTDVYSARKGHSIFISHCAAFLVLMVYKWAFKSASAAQVLLLALVVYGLTPLWTNGVDQRSDSILCGDECGGDFLTHVTGNGGLWQVSEAPKYFGGGVKKRIKFPLPPLTDHPDTTPPQVSSPSQPRQHDPGCAMASIRKSTPHEATDAPAPQQSPRADINDSKIGNAPTLNVNAPQVGGLHHSKPDPASMGPLNRVQYFVSERRFDAFESNINGMVGTVIKDAVDLDPWMPKAVQAGVEKSWEVLWVEIVDAMRDDWMKNNAGDDHSAQHQALFDLSTWPPAPSYCPNVLRTLRARVLYALFPADKSIWYIVQQPLAIFLMFLLVAPFGISTVMWMLLLLLIEKGEYQLVNWVLLFKSTNFLKFGLLPLFKNYFELYFRVTAGNCHVPGPLDTSANVANALFIGSWSLGWLAFGLYKHRRAQRAAELSDGYTVGEGGLQGAVLADDLLLTRMMIWDFIAFWLVILFGALDLVSRVDGATFSRLGSQLILFFGGGGAVDTLHTDFFELLTCALGLTSMPFLLLKLPDVGQFLLRLFPTGYDQAGHLRLMMSIREMKKKWEAEQDLDKMDLDGDGKISFSEFASAWWSDAKKKWVKLYGPGCGSPRTPPRSKVAPVLNLM
jgi:hypothetical protein